MKSKVAKVVSVLLTGTLLASFAACNRSGYRDGPADEIEANYQWATEANWNGTDVMDSSEIESYSGQHQIDLTAWNTKGTGNFKTYDSSDDRVTTEIKRITGVSVDEDNSFDNKGQTADVRFNNLLSNGMIPDIAYGTGWLDTEEVWDLTELIEEYCPTIKARMPDYVWKNENVNGGQPGKVYGIPYGLYSISLTSVDPLADVQNSIMFEHLNESCPYVLVREDILLDAEKNLEAAFGDDLTILSSEQIDRIYAEDGKFTEDQLFDIPITSAEDFREKFLPAIQKTIEEGATSNPDRYVISGNRKVTPMLVTGGRDADTWDFMGKLVPYLLGAGANSMNTNMSYWDVETQKVESMLYQDFYRDEVKEWAKMVQEGTVIIDNDEFMNTNHTDIQSMYNSGYIAVGYLSNSMPSGNICTWKGEKINYRKVYLNIPINTDKFMYCGYGEAVVNSVKFFKDTVREDELPQLLRWLDFQCSRTADYLYAWGPDGDNALFTTDAEGNRRYKDTDLDEQMVYSTATMGEKVQRYNLSNGTVESANVVFSFYYQGGSIYHPKSTYDLSGLTGLAESFYSSAAVLTEMTKQFVGIKLNPSIHVWTDSNLDGIEAVWAKRPNIEDQLKQLLRAGASDATFTSAWNTLQSLLDTSGWTKQYFNGAVTNAFLTANADYADKFYKGA